MNYKLRLKHPSGAEFEAEGPADFILTEKKSFLKELGSGKPAGRRTERGAEAPEETPWDRITEAKNGRTILKRKHPGLKAAEAALL